MIATFFQFLAIRSVSVSKPTRKRKRDRPIDANNLRRDRDAGGRIAPVKPGIKERAVGPRRIPAISSPRTTGCPIFLKAGEGREREERG